MADPEPQVPEPVKVSEPQKVEQQEEQKKENLPAPKPWAIGSRPPQYTYYHERMPQMILEFIYRQVAMRQMPTRSGLCIHLGVSRDTVNNYEQRYPEFARSIQMLREAQENLLLQRLAKGKCHPAGSMFILKNLHGYKDTHDFDHTVGTKKQVMIINGQEVEF